MILSQCTNKIKEHVLIFWVLIWHIYIDRSKLLTGMMFHHMLLMRHRLIRGQRSLCQQHDGYTILKPLHQPYCSHPPYGVKLRLHCVEMIYFIFVKVNFSGFLRCSWWCNFMYYFYTYKIKIMYFDSLEMLICGWWLDTHEILRYWATSNSNNSTVIW